MTFSLGLVACGLAVIGVGHAVLRGAEQSSGLPFAAPRTSSTGWGEIILPFAFLLLLIFLSTTLAAPVWRFLPFLARTLTYPWQLLLLAGPWLAWLAGLGGRAVLDSWPPEAVERRAIPLFAGLLVLILLEAYAAPLVTLSPVATGSPRQVLSPVTQSAPVPDAPLAIFGDNEIALLRAEITGAAGPGGRVTALVSWQALRRLNQDYTVFFHALGPDGNRWGQQDTMPQAGMLPTSQWRPGQVVQDQYQLTLAADAPVGGDYRYLLGLYQWQTGQRLSAGADDKVVVTP